jgi:hypothetical protein
VKSLGYNTTNGRIVAATNVVWTNAFSFSTNTVAAQVRTNLGLGTTNNVTFDGLTAGFVTFDNVQIGPDLQLEENGQVKWGTFVRFAVDTMQFFEAISFNNTTNAATTRTNLGLGATNDVTFKNITIADQTLTLSHGSEDDVFVRNDSGNLELESPVQIIAFSQISFNDTAHAAATRANLGLGLPALTNTSNVTTMRALAGSTNTNEPYSGTVALTNTNVLTFSNGVLLKIQ